MTIDADVGTRAGTGAGAGAGTAESPIADRTTVAIAGGGPAGVMLGLLLARQGLHVTVLEQYPDFLRDFRGDTVHPATQVVLQQLGLLAEFDTFARGRMHAIDIGTADGPLVHQELRDVRRRFPFHEIALAPQWDLLDLLVRAGRRYPGFHLRMRATTTGVVRGRDGAVRGLRYREQGDDHDRTLRAVLTVDAEGRHSVLRDEVGGGLIELGAPIDVLWFRIDRRADDPAELRGMLGRGGAVVAIDRKDYWQIAFVIPKGSVAEVRAAGLPAFRSRIEAIAPWTAGRLAGIVDWDEVKLLSVSVERLRRWSAPGILAIGDAAHTMSPMGGVGINLAIGDAVATANLLGAALLRAQADPRRFERVLNPALLDRVQRRRSFATIATQRIQVAAQQRVLALTSARSGQRLLPPAPVLALLRSPLARVVPSIFVFGIRPERIRTAA